ncbi:MAG TPA: hypothetical protein PLX66_00340 [Bacilli bacterium]|nr:hypothetical protein [Bacilli bacterium]
MPQKNNIKLWLFLLVLSVIFVGVTIYFTTKKLKEAAARVETYVIYNYDFAYYYDGENWSVLDDTSFIPTKQYLVYNGNSLLGKSSASINQYTRKIGFSIGEKSYSDLIGISSNKTIPFESYEIEDLTTEDINYLKEYLISKKETYVGGTTEVKKLEMDIDADALKENIFEIYYKNDSTVYNYIIIKDDSNTETVVAYSGTESETNFKKYSIRLIIDTNLNEKKEILVIEDGYEYSILDLYANQYGTYSLVE